ncbi:DUF6602 domain-containing protein [Candidatus Sumerlaeota bacterium]
MIEQDFEAYHRSIATEIKCTKNRVRNLIGSAHWGEEGRYKEAILRKILRNYISEQSEIGQGFICYDGSCSTQIDILIFNRQCPTLFRDNDFLIVTPLGVQAVIEVKTGVTIASLKDEIRKLSRMIAKIRDVGGQENAWAGLFAIEDRAVDPEELLDCLDEQTESGLLGAINCLAIGGNRFVRFWPGGHEKNSGNEVPEWRYYDLHDLAPAYFVSNCVYRCSVDATSRFQYAWFPLENGKEQHCKFTKAVSNSHIQ